MGESITPKENDDGGTSVSMEPDPDPEPEPTALTNAGASRKVKRKVAKKEKRKQTRKELAEKARAEEEARLNDPEEQRRIQLEEEREIERLERERKEFEEREKLFLEELARKQAEDEEAEESRKSLEEELKRNQGCEDNELNEDDEWEYVEEGPPEIIWQGNEIIVKKNRVKVKKKDANQLIEIEDPNRPTSNPLPPQSEAYTAHKDASKLSAQQLLENVAQEVSNFGTEQDKAHCPFHIKTGACRFGLRCNRAHFYPDKSCTLLIKNMYMGPGLAWEHDEGLELFSRSTMEVHNFGLSYVEDKKAFADHEEVEHCYEEFYEDVHTEFLKFGEIVNFKVCRNGSFHLRGNVYIHYKSLDSAVLAYHAVNGRYFAGKQVTCEFVSVTKWKVAICGEYMKSRLKTCSRGTACNFLHCFGNPGGDYEWADWDRPPPRYWMKKMTALFGYSDESWYDRDQQMEQGSPRDWQNYSRISLTDRDRYHSRRSRSRKGEGEGEGEDTNGRYARSYDKHDEKYQKKHTHDGRKRLKSLDENCHEERNYDNHHHDKNLSSESDSDRSRTGRDTKRDESRKDKRRRSRHEHEKTQSRDYVASRSRASALGSDKDSPDVDIVRYHNGSRKRSTHVKEVPEHPKLEEESVRKRTHSSRRGHLSLEASKVSSSEEHIKSSEMGHRESDIELLSDKHKRSKRKLTFDGINEHYPNEDNEEEDRWKPDENSPNNDHRKSRGLLDDDLELYEQKTGSRSRRTRWSSRERRSESLEGVIKSEDNYKRSREKHGSCGRSGKGEGKKSGSEKQT